MENNLRNQYQKTSLADLLGNMKFLLRKLEIRIYFTHVYSNIDKHLKWDDITREQ